MNSFLADKSLLSQDASGSAHCTVAGCRALHSTIRASNTTCIACKRLCNSKLSADLLCWLVQEIAEENMSGVGEQLRRQQSAVQRATRLLLNRQSAPTPLVLTYLPWLISASPKHALSVLKVVLAFAAKPTLRLLLSSTSRHRLKQRPAAAAPHSLQSCVRM